MTDQYRATPKQWDNQKAWAVDDDDSSCILELRARVEALEELHNAVMDLNKRFSLDPLVDRVEELEARYETQRQVTLAWGKDVYNHGRWIDAHLKRIKALEAGQKPNYPEIPDSSPAPADSLVERVCVEAGIHNPADARAAIREVAAALIDWHDSDEVVRTAWEAGKWLEREADA
jgi:hypothetical protein